MVISELAKEWMDAGISQGDTVLIHSDLKRTLRRYLRQRKEISPKIVLDSFIEAVGPSGTLLLPLFNFDFTKGVSFDIRETPSHMGILTEEARGRPRAGRTGHPIYSFAAIGKHAEQFNKVDNFSGYGPDSPFAILRELDGKIAVLDLADHDSMTFYHHVEEMHSVPYRYHKLFTGEYTDREGHARLRTYGIFVRNIDEGVITLGNSVGELMWKRGLYVGCRPNERSGLRVVSARAMFDFVSDIITSGRARGLLYKIEGENEDEP